MSDELEVVGTLRSPFREKFGLPRQPGLVRGLRCRLEIAPDFARDDFWRGIEGFSHVWLLWRFHLDAGRGGHTRPTVRPPRLGGEERRGVFATRSGFRPNGLGLSVVPLHGVVERAGGLVLELGAADLVDGTPVVDVKPYLPWADALPEASGGFAPTNPGETGPRRRVVFSEGARRGLDARRVAHPELEDLLTDLLALDPRPAWDRERCDPERVFAAWILDFDLKWREDGERVEVIDLALRP